jgi:hypothetical protein
MGRVPNAATFPPAKAPIEFQPVSPYCGVVRMLVARTDLSVKHPMTAESMDAEANAMGHGPTQALATSS